MNPLFHSASVGVTVMLLCSLSAITLAQEAPRTIDLTNFNYITSWTADPFMSQSEEQSIVKWLKSRPRASQMIETLEELRNELENSIHGQCHAMVTLDVKSLEELGLSPETPANGETDRLVTVGADLIQLLKGLDLTYVIHRGNIEITTLDDADQNGCDSNLRYDSVAYG